MILGQMRGSPTTFTIVAFLTPVPGSTSLVSLGMEFTGLGWDALPCHLLLALALADSVSQQESPYQQRCHPQYANHYAHFTIMGTWVTDRLLNSETDLTQ